MHKLQKSEFQNIPQVTLSICKRGLATHLPGVHYRPSLGSEDVKLQVVITEQNKPLQ